MKNKISNLYGLTLLSVMLLTANLTFAQTPATPPSQTNPPPQAPAPPQFQTNYPFAPNPPAQTNPPPQAPAAPNQGTKPNTP